MLRRSFLLVSAGVLVVLGFLAGWWADRALDTAEPVASPGGWERPLRLTAAVVEMRLTEMAVEAASGWLTATPETPPAGPDDGGARLPVATAGTPPAARAAIPYDCAGALTAGRDVVMHRELLCWLSSATLRPLAAGWNYDAIRELEVLYHSPTGGGSACLRDGDHGNAPLTSLCPDAGATPVPPEVSDVAVPLREHHAAALGTGVLGNATVSDGMVPVAQTAIDRDAYRIQRVRWEEQPAGCGVSVYRTDRLWVGAAYPTSLTLNGEPVGEVVAPTGSHGAIVPLRIEMGDRVCIGTPRPGGFHLVWGPDMLAHYDSYCYRGHCG